MSNKVYVETTNFNTFTLEFKKFRGHIDIINFLKAVVNNLEEDDAFSLYTDYFDGNKRYKISFTSRHNSVNDSWYNIYSFELVNHSEGEEVLEVIYNGEMLNRIMHLIWQYRVIVNKGLDGMC